MAERGDPRITLNDNANVKMWTPGDFSLKSRNTLIDLVKFLQKECLWVNNRNWLQHVNVPFVLLQWSHALYFRAS